MAELTRLAPDERPQTLRQIIGFRKRGSIHQYRYYPYISLERSLDLYTNRIVRIVDSSSRAISDRKPFSPD